jgi:preprotein translocase subunit YajC
VTPDQLSPLLLPFLLVVVFWLLIIRPARRRQRDIARIQSSLEPGSTVMLSSGLYGEVASIDDADIRLTVAPGVTLTVHRQAVAKVVEAHADEPPADVPLSDVDTPDRSTDR